MANNNPPVLHPGVHHANVVVPLREEGHEREPSVNGHAILRDALLSRLVDLWQYNLLQERIYHKLLHQQWSLVGHVFPAGLWVLRDDKVLLYQHYCLHHDSIRLFRLSKSSTP